MKKLLNQKGVSLVQVMVAAGLMGLVSISLMRLQKNTMMFSNSVDAKFETDVIMMKVKAIIANKETCNTNFQNQNVNNTTLESLVNMNGHKIISTLEEENTNPKIEITSIEIQPKLVDDGSGTLVNSSSIFNLAIGIKRKASIVGAKEQIKNVLVLADINSETGIINSCETNDNELVNAATQMICNGPGVVYNEATGECSISSIGETQVCENGQAIRKIIFDQTTNTYRGVCSQVISQTECPAEQVLIGYNSNGLPVCEDPKSRIHGLDANNIALNKIVNKAGINVNGSFVYLTVSNGMISLTTSDAPPPPSCTCSEWSPWTNVASGWSCQYGCQEWNYFTTGTRTTCQYKRVCVTKTPADCDVTIQPQNTAPQETDFYVYFASLGGGQYTYPNRDEAAGAACPAASVFGL